MMSPCPGSTQTRVDWGRGRSTSRLQSVGPWRAELGELLSFTEIRQRCLCFPADAGIEGSFAAKSSGEVFAVPSWIA
jgi:hypothetical protein